MQNLVLVLISLAITLAVAGVTAYFGGRALSSQQTRNTAMTLINQGNQIASASIVYSSDHSGKFPATPQTLVTATYLQTLPIPPQGAYATGAGSASAEHWAWLSEQAPHLVLPEKVSRAVCEEINLLANNEATIPPALKPEWLVQCYGDTEPYTFYYDPPGSLETDRRILAAAYSAKTLLLSPSSWSFPDTPTGSQSTGAAFVLTNTGTENVAVNGVETVPPFVITANTCASSLAPSTSCTVEVKFAPSVAGYQTGNLTVASDATGQPHLASLAGTGISGPVLVIEEAGSPATQVAFGNVRVGTQSPSRTVTLRNTGAAALANPTLAGTDGTPFSYTSSCGSSLDPSSSCAVNLQFSPATVGLAEATLTITGSNLASSSTLALSGTGISGPEITGASTNAISTEGGAIVDLYGEDLYDGSGTVSITVNGSPARVLGVYSTLLRIGIPPGAEGPANIVATLDGKTANYTLSYVRPRTYTTVQTVYAGDLLGFAVGADSTLYFVSSSAVWRVTGPTTAVNTGISYPEACPGAQSLRDLAYGADGNYYASWTCKQPSFLYPEVRLLAFNAAEQIVWYGVVASGTAAKPQFAEPGLLGANLRGQLAVSTNNSVVIFDTATRTVVPTGSLAHYQATFGPVPFNSVRYPSTASTPFLLGAETFAGFYLANETASLSGQERASGVAISPTGDVYTLYNGAVFQKRINWTLLKFESLGAIAGQYGTSGYVDGPTSAARFRTTSTGPMRYGPDGSLYIRELGRIRRIY